MGIAGLWASWHNPEDVETLYSFTMLTINADDHEFMRNYHKPDDEKRVLCFLQDDEYEAWLSESVDASHQFQRQFPSELLAIPEELL